MRSLAQSLFALTLVTSTLAANKYEWASRSIYQIITDRFAPPSQYAPARTSPIPSTCDPILQTWCGGTWLSIIEKLDYIQGMGFDSIWISPISQNIDVWTPYNYAYHGYWVDNPTLLNPRFGSHDDLILLSKTLHDRGMFLMVDIVVNNIPSLNVSVAGSNTALISDNSLWQNPDEFHELCWINYNNQTSVEYCWLGDDNLPLMDVNTENPTVISTLQSWIANFTQTYSIDGLRIDAAKHIPGPFWPGFCGAAGVFCIGEVYGADIPFASSFQTQNYMDSVLGYPLYYGFVQGFGTPMGNMTGLVEIAEQVLSAFPEPGLLGNFLENHDLPRWRNMTVDPQLAYNAQVAQFIFDGIPIVYYGQEQDFHAGAGDPYNRQALWPSNYANTSTYNRLGKLNHIRQAVIKNNTLFEGKTFLNYSSQIVASTPYDIAIRKGPLLAVLTNRGSPSQNASFGISGSGWSTSSTVIDILSCQSFTVGANSTISVSYAASGYGGMPYLFIGQSDANALGVCGSTDTMILANGTEKTNAAWPTTAPSMDLRTMILPLLLAGIAAFAL